MGAERYEEGILFIFLPPFFCLNSVHTVIFLGILMRLPWLFQFAGGVASAEPVNCAAGGCCRCAVLAPPAGSRDQAAGSCR